MDESHSRSLSRRELKEPFGREGQTQKSAATAVRGPRTAMAAACLIEAASWPRRARPPALHPAARPPLVDTCGSHKQRQQEQRHVLLRETPALLTLPAARSRELLPRLPRAAALARLLDGLRQGHVQRGHRVLVRVALAALLQASLRDHVVGESRATPLPRSGALWPARHAETRDKIGVGVDKWGAGGARRAIGAPVRARPY